MYHKTPYTGVDLPLKYLCLTYDDGPGKHTYDIAKYLYDQNILATFFVVGKYAIHHQNILEKLSQMGHLIGNHTFEHPDMPYFLSVNGDVHNQILRTDAIIKKYVKAETTYFRSPYGKWSDEVANELNLNMLCVINHLGPIHWDVGGVDCFYWKNGHTVEDTVNKYLSDINEKQRGIVVMHDEIADMNFLKNSNNTFELTKQLVPILKTQGYKFVRLDEIASIKEDALKQLKFSLKDASGKFMGISESENNTVNFEGSRNSRRNELSMTELGHGRIALKGCNGLYFSLRNDKEHSIKASGNEVKENETFDLIPLSANQIALRAFNGNYLARERKGTGRLLASATFMRESGRFNFFPVNMQPVNKIPLREKYKLLKRQLLYIKSKIQQGA